METALKGTTGMQGWWTNIHDNIKLATRLSLISKISLNFQTISNEERFFRITEIYEGTTEIQAVVIAGHMQKEYRNAQIAKRKAVN